MLSWLIIDKFVRRNKKQEVEKTMWVLLSTQPKPQSLHIGHLHMVASSKEGGQKAHNQELPGSSSFRLPVSEPGEGSEWDDSPAQPSVAAQVPVA